MIPPKVWLPNGAQSAPDLAAIQPVITATPTKWTYKAIYRVRDHQVGQWSGEVSVIVGG